MPGCLPFSMMPRIMRRLAVRGEAASGARSGEHAAQEAAGRHDAGQCRSEGSAVKKVVAPAAKREAVAHLQALLDVSEQRACRIIEADRTSMRYQSRRADDAEFREKLRALA